MPISIQIHGSMSPTGETKQIKPCELWILTEKFSPMYFSFTWHFYDSFSSHCNIRLSHVVCLTSGTGIPLFKFLDCRRKLLFRLCYLRAPVKNHEAGANRAFPMYISNSINKREDSMFKIKGYLANSCNSFISLAMDSTRSNLFSRSATSCSTCEIDLHNPI